MRYLNPLEDSANLNVRTIHSVVPTPTNLQRIDACCTILQLPGLRELRAESLAASLDTKQDMIQKISCTLNVVLLKQHR